MNVWQLYKLAQSEQIRLKVTSFESQSKHEEG